MKNTCAETKFDWLTLAEGLLIIYFLFGLVQALYFKNYGSIPLLMMAFTGFSMVFGWSALETRKNVKPYKNVFAIE